MPRRGVGDQLRAAVVPEPGHVLLTADFSNIEMRILADLSGDEAMLGMFADGADLHSQTVRTMFKLAADVDVKTTIWKRGMTYRDVGKVLNFRTVYGGGEYGLARLLEIPTPDAREIQDAYFATFPGVRRWMDRVTNETGESLQSVTRSGRLRRYAIDPSDREQLAGVLRQAKNTPIQGTSADITKLMMALLYEYARDHHHLDGDDRWRLVAVVHDEGVLEAPAHHGRLAGRALVNAMDQAARHYLPTVALPPPTPPTPLGHWAKE